MPVYFIGRCWVPALRQDVNNTNTKRDLVTSQRRGLSLESNEPVRADKAGVQSWPIFRKWMASDFKVKYSPARLGGDPIFSQPTHLDTRSLSPQSGRICSYHRAWGSHRNIESYALSGCTELGAVLRLSMFTFPSRRRAGLQINTVAHQPPLFPSSQVKALAPLKSSRGYLAGHKNTEMGSHSDPASGRSATVNAGYSHFQPRGRFWTAARGEEQCRIEWAFSPRQWAFQHASWQQANNRRLRLSMYTHTHTEYSIQHTTCSVGVILNTSTAFWSPQLGRAESMTSRVPPNWKPPKNGDGTKWGVGTADLTGQLAVQSEGEKGAS
uniref:Uncharacterized protein n=1 Tax=Coccidioides posadasii RMSCC 3488 TaxID=454284 RepID=A0A0J6EXT8_COCPO|nr:hypothetical protein CPAG_01732 [Coccidioides posadasii RMSCC 3488]